MDDFLGDQDTIIGGSTRNVTTLGGANNFNYLENGLSLVTIILVTSL